MPLDLGALAAALASRARQTCRLEGFRAAAVLVPILVEPARPERLILTVRDAGLRSHAGQISFPGGKCDEGDADAATTAIRETSEELGVEPAAIEVLGLLDDVPTPTGFVITPVVAEVRGPVVLRPAAAEVAEVFLPELAALGDPAAHASVGEREWMGVRWERHEYRWGGFRIWGATARILWQLLPLLDGGAAAASARDDRP
jgi:8-oxo-dGTP pyrophosphatase MutT (NUDIX family)